MTDEITSTAEHHAISSYSLPLESFNQIPQEIVRYRDGDRITRENFTSFLIHSFALSRGVASGQRAYIDWIEANQGFDSMTAIRNFTQADPEDILSEEEKLSIAKAFNKVKVHGDSIDTVHPVYAFVHSVKSLSQMGSSVEFGSDFKGVPLSLLTKKIDEEYKRRAAIKASPSYL